MPIFSMLKKFTTKLSLSNGRVRRRSYIIRANISILLIVFISNATENNLFNLFIIAGLVYFISQTIKRLHDINLSGWWTVLMIVPILNIIMGIFVSYKKGTKGNNKYGSDPKTIFTPANYQI